MEQESSVPQPFSAADTRLELQIDRSQIDRKRGRTGAAGLKALPSALYAAMSDEEKYIVTSAVGRCMDGLLRSGKAIFLEGLGIIFPETVSATKSYAVDSQLAVRRETVTSINFEKCVEVVAPHRERFGAIVESRELATRVYPNLPLLLQLRWSIDELKRRIQGLVKAIRLEVVTNGVSKKLDKVGTLYALNNRHGYGPDDWYAGADIFISSPLKWVQQVDDAHVYERPVLNDSGELFQAAFGAPVASFDVDVLAELKKVPGLSMPDLPEELRRIKGKIFKVTHKGAVRSYLFCSEGVRRLAIGHDPRRILRCELTMEVAAESQSSDDREFPLWPQRAFALGAVLIAQQLLGRDCAWMGGSVPIAEHEATALEAVLLQRFSPVAHEQLCDEGEFSYVNIIGLASDEVALGESEGLSHLLALLRRKGLDQVTKLSRTSVIARTTINPPAAQPRVITRGRSTDGLGAVQ